MNIELTAEDPAVPEGCIPNAAVRVVQYVQQDGSLGFGIRISSDVPLSQVLGLLVMAGIHAYAICDPGPPRDQP